MPWKEETPVFKIRYEFVRAHQSGLYTMTELCELYGVSRNNGYKWLRRYREGGAEGLHDLSRRPQSLPLVSSEYVVDAILALRDKHPTWGARKLKSFLERNEPDQRWPCKSTVHDILNRCGRVRERSRRRKHAHPGKPVVEAEVPNQVWSADYKGDFRLQNGRRCYPLTVLDGYSRYLLACRGLPGTGLALAQQVFRELFETYGLPEFILTDNGNPFVSTGLCGLSRLSAWWIRLGIIPKRTQPGHPEQNGRHERMHKTLKAEATRPPEKNLRAQQKVFGRFQRVFNRERPHEALEMQTPADRYAPSLRPYPTRLPRLEYPSHAEVRLVSNNGGIRWNGQYLFVSQAIAQQHVALEEIEDGIWSLYFGPVEIGRLNERTGTIT
jgi:putative transposase